MTYLERDLSVSEYNNSFLYNNRNISTAFVKNNYDLQLVFKSLSLADTKNMLNAVRNSNDTSIKRKFTEWQTYKSILTKQYALPADKRRTDLDQLEKKAEETEKELNRRSSVFRDQQAALQVTTAEVKKYLDEDEAAIEFVKFSLYTNKKWTDSVVYGAYILRKNEQEVRFVVLCFEDQLRQVFDSAGKSATTMVNSFYRGLDLGKNVNTSLGPKLYQLVWKPIEPYLKGITKIAYSPAGKLYSIAFQALPADSGKVLMDKYRLQQYTSTRQIAFRDGSNKSIIPEGITLFGNPDFSADSISLSKQKKNPAVVNKLLKPDTRGNAGLWTSLPGTAEEVKKISNLFSQYQVTAKTLTQLNASEENLKAQHEKSSQVLHIATHGFFLPMADKKEAVDINRQNNYSLAQDPLMRSGLILSGGNYAWSGKTPIEGVEDGIVTAYEISQLDLSNTELVVLSACETALGDVKGSEGVFGLQRAFKMAGVKKMIVSLWQVPDKETAELMTTFYTYWMKGKTINDAFAQAQADMRKKYSPFYWAAFVLVE
jgi:CHAT domain-containing protein